MQNFYYKGGVMEIEIGKNLRDVVIYYFKIINSAPTFNGVLEGLKDFNFIILELIKKAKNE